MENETWIECLNCHATFLPPPRAKRPYCSFRCRQAMAQMRMKAKKAGAPYEYETMVEQCHNKECNKPFEKLVRHWFKTYCSNKCRQHVNHLRYWGEKIRSYENIKVETVENNSPLPTEKVEFSLSGPEE